MPRSILLVDDNPGVLHTLRRFFDRSGWEVEEAVTGEDALRLYAARLPDVVVLDIDLPGASGLDVLGVLVSQGAAVVMLTGQAEIGLAVEAVQMGAENFLTKPIQFDHLLASAERAAEKAELRRANRQLAEQVTTRGRVATLGVSPLMRGVEEQVQMLGAAPDVTVLLQGESGTGKTLVAQMLHTQSERARGPFVEINCAGLSATFLDSELFGHEKGAFTDAKETKRGLFEVADRGTIFLDEIGDLDPALQPKLLKVLETRSFRRLGGVRELRTDVRVVAATHANLEEAVKQGRFREDLYYRLCVFPLTIPPLRERSKEDVLTLVQHLWGELAGRYPGAPHEFAARALDLLVGYSWPGNVRELRNVLERAAVLSRGAERVAPEHLTDTVRAPGSLRTSRYEHELLPLEEVERRHIERALYATGGNRTTAAEQLGIARATLHTKIKQYGLDRVGRGSEISN